MTTLKSMERIAIRPSEALEKLKEGNFRFINNMTINRDLLNMVNDTQDEQLPYAAILSCMDSRVSAELIFDQGVGDIFSIRIAGNVITDGILGSLEYATSVAGAKLILVLGHTNCGAIRGACANVKMGHVTSLLEKIEPAKIAASAHISDVTPLNPQYIAAVTRHNVHNSIKEISERSGIIRELVKSNELVIAPAIYDVATGKVSFNIPVLS